MVFIILSPKLFLFIYLFILFILSLTLTITEQILLTIKNSSKILLDVNTLVKKPSEHKALYIRNIKDKTSVLLKFSYIMLL